MARTNEFRVDASEVVDLADRLQLLASGRLADAMASVVNDVADRFDTRARQAMNAGINLDDGYISSKMSRERAAPGSRAVATITTRGDVTILGRYDPQVLTTAAKGKAKGDPSRGIPAGQKAAGVQVTVRKGAPRVLGKAFTMPLKNNDKTGVFIREGERVKHLYGVSPYSLFRFQIESGVDEIERDLAATADAAIVDEVGKVFG